MSGLVDIRCPCSRRVLLAKLGVDEDGRAWIGIRARKGSRVITDTKHWGGRHDLWCSECHRITKIHLTPRGSTVIPPGQKPIRTALPAHDGPI